MSRQDDERRLEEIEERAERCYRADYEDALWLCAQLREAWERERERDGAIAEHVMYPNGRGKPDA